jgi:hypothetical protein
MPHADWLITGLEKVRSEIHLARSRNSSCPLVKKFILPAPEIF